MPCILVTGATGQLGQELQQLAAHKMGKKYQDFEFIFADRSALPLDNLAAVAAYFDAADFSADYCINCAAYTAVDKAEIEQESAFRVNAEAVELIAQKCQSKGIKLLHISTDYAYHNGQNTPLLETDATNPQGVYAASKLEGEKRAFQACPSTIVVRTSWVYSAFGHNFVKTMLRLSEQRPQLNVVYDQIGAPTYAADLAAALLDMILWLEAPQNPHSEALGRVYNFSNEGVTSWYDFAKAIFALENKNCEVSPIRSSQYPTPAQRPPYSLMDKSRIKGTFGITIPHWLDALERMLVALKAQVPV